MGLRIRIFEVEQDGLERVPRGDDEWGNHDRGWHLSALLRQRASAEIGSLLKRGEIVPTNEAHCYEVDNSKAAKKRTKPTNGFAMFAARRKSLPALPKSKALDGARHWKPLGTKHWDEWRMTSKDCWCPDCNKPRKQVAKAA